MRLYAFLLYPFAVLYDLITRVRNLLFDLGWFTTHKSPITSILVGNLRVGGTGKTPMVEFLIKKLKTRKNLATLSRGYGRSTKGFLKATLDTTPDQIGDEPFQIYEKFAEDISVFVGEERVEAVKKIAGNFPKVEMVILDDAFQHRHIQADLNILLTTFQQPFTSDYLLPMGRLRESRSGAKRADLIIVTKSPLDLEKQKKSDLIQQIAKYNQKAPVIFSSIGYGKPYPLIPENGISQNVILLSGIANDKELKTFLSDNYEVLETLKFPDHHSYQVNDFEKIREVYLKYSTKNPVIITTEKDSVKVKSTCPEGFLREIPIFVLPIQVVFSAEDEQIIESLIDQVIL